MTTYIFTITLLNGNNNIEYKTIEGVYSDKETAKKVATEKIKAQKSFWNESYICILGKGKVALKNGPENISKIYHIQEMEVK